MTPRSSTVAALALVAAALPAFAHDPNAARNLAATCFTCHGTDGRSVSDVPPSLAGRKRDELLKMLFDFKAGTRPATVMHQHARGYTDEQLGLIADYFSQRAQGRPAPVPRP